MATRSKYATGIYRIDIVTIIFGFLINNFVYKIHLNSDHEIQKYIFINFFFIFQEN